MNILEVIQKAKGFQLYSLSGSLSPKSMAEGFDKAYSFPQRILIVPSLEKDHQQKSEGSKGDRPDEKSTLDNVKMNVHLSSESITANNSRYHSSVKLIEDPCIYRMMGTSNGSNEDRKDGRIDLCRNLVIVGEKERKFSNENGEFVFTSDLEEHAESKRTENRENKISSEEAGDNNQQHTLKIFVVNSYSRLKELKSEVVGETERIMKLVAEIFRNSNAPVKIRLTGVASLGNDIELTEDDPDMLYAFRRVISPVRYNSRNLKYPLGDSDVVVFLTNNVNIEKRSSVSDGEMMLRSKKRADSNSAKRKKRLQTHGMSFYAGSSMLSRSYAVVFSSKEESRLFVAKKIAHELGHLLGCSHDSEEGYLMEARSCVGCEDVPRVFSKESLKSIKHFVKMNKEFFTGHLERQNETGKGKPVTSLEDARAFVNGQRKHSYRDIVETRLNGIAPEGLCSLCYLFFSLCVYLACISFAIYHFS